MFIAYFPVLNEFNDYICDIQAVYGPWSKADSPSACFWMVPGTWED